MFEKSKDPIHAIIVTGASSGIGYSLVKALACQNRTVFAVARREDRLKELGRYGANIIPIVADISEEHGQEKIVTAVAKLNQPLYIIHNAAIPALGTIKDIDNALFRQAMETNFFAPVLLTKLLLPFCHHSRLLNISSGLAHYALQGTPAYCMSKAALFMFYQCLNVEFKAETLLAGSLEPGVVDTDMQLELRSSTAEKLPVREKFQKLYEQGQLVSAEQISQFIIKVLFETTDEEFSEKKWRFEA
jgi:benzil reductase ((S)-benzoin forming)